MSLLTSSLRHWGSPNAKINSLIPSPTLLRSVDAMPIPKEKNDLVLLSNATRARSISHRSYSCCSWGNSCRYFSISHASFIVYFPHPNPSPLLQHDHSKINQYSQLYPHSLWAQDNILQTKSWQRFDILP